MKIKDSIINSKLKPAFIPFITAGFPSLDITKELLLLFDKIGVAAIEVGIPFSDPLADGPVIQKAAKYALDKGVNIDKIFEMLENVSISTPIILFSYANPILRYGFEKTVKKAKTLGVKGFIIPDMPLEEAEEFANLCKENDLNFIYLAAPTSDEDRIKKVSQKSSGFIYLVSSAGVTGVREGFAENILYLKDKIKENTDNPVALGFGISKKEHVEMAKKEGFDAVIVGSAIIKVIQAELEKETFANPEEIIEKIKSYVYSLYDF